MMRLRGEPRLVSLCLLLIGCEALVDDGADLETMEVRCDKNPNHQQCDTTPPTIAISSPVTGATVSGQVTVSGTASDDRMLARVEVQVDSGSFGAASGLAAWTFSLNTLALANGSHSITARGVDAAGNVATRSITINVSNTTTPPPPTDEVVINASPGGLAAAVTQVKNANVLGKPVRLVLQPGRYRESLIIAPWASATTAPIVVDGGGAATITGADVFSSWTAVGDGTYRHAWPHNLGNMADPWPTLTYDRVLLNREAMFIGQMPYHVVDSAAKLVPGTFLVDEANDLVIARPREGDAPITSAEITVRLKVMWVDGHSNVTVRNMTLERGAGAVQETMARGWSSPNFRLENVTVRQAAATGFAVGGGTGSTWSNVRFLDNGIVACGSYQQNGIVIENAELTRTNWRGAQVGFTGWSAGTKFGLSRNITINGWNSHGNYSHGLWFDWDNRNIVVNGLISAGNLGRGVFLESNPGPITIDGATICNNGFGGISYARTDHATVRNSLLFMNAGWQHFTTGNATPPTMSDGYVIHGRWVTLQNNVTVGDDWPAKDSIDRGWLLAFTRDDPAFWDTLVASGNTWYHTVRTNPFRVSPIWNEWLTYSQYAVKAGETDGQWLNPGPLTCPAPRPAYTVDYAVGW